MSQYGRTETQVSYQVVLPDSRILLVKDGLDLDILLNSPMVGVYQPTQVTIKLVKEK